jgi:cob(I)alamin adenosyltransferase
MGTIGCLLTSTPMRIYTRRGDDGSTGLYHGGRVPKDDAGPEAYGTVDEAVSLLGAARADADDQTAAALLAVQRQLFVVGAELATDPAKRDRLEDGVSRVDQTMVDGLEERIDAVVAGHDMPSEFIVPGGDPVAAAIDVARSVIRRAERRAVTWAREEDARPSLVVGYLNRLADYLYVLARAVEGEWVPSREESDD